MSGKQLENNWLVRRCAAITLALICCSATTAHVRGAEIEFLNGRKLTAKVLSKSKTHLTVESKVGNRTVRRRYPLSSIHKVTIGSKVYPITPKKNASASSGSSASAAPSSGRVSRTSAQVTRLIQAQGSEPPSWYQSTKLEYPKTLDLAWPMPAPKPWNSQKNVGQYIWDRINPNKSRWQSGIRLMHHMLTVNSRNRKTQTRIMNSIGAMYFRFFQDYPRAAFWWQKAGVRPGQENSEGLAECYWRLGNKEMAYKMLNRNALRLASIKLISDMGDTDAALRLADEYTRRVSNPQQKQNSLFIAGDACRRSQRFRDALRYYQRVLDLPQMKNPQYDKRSRGRANDAIAAIRQYELFDLAKVPDGTFTDTSTGYEGPLTVEVKVAQRKIQSVRVTKHREKQFYAALDDIPAQILQKQTVKGIDATSRATITAEAIINATAKALAQKVKQ